MLSHLNKLRHTSYIIVQYHRSDAGFDPVVAHTTRPAECFTLAGTRGMRKRAERRQLQATVLTVSQYEYHSHTSHAMYH